MHIPHLSTSLRRLSQALTGALCASAMGMLLLGSAAPAAAESLSTQPLSLKGGVPPTVMFALSVEFPTANTAAYQDSASYSNTGTYLGYFDAGKCYSYNYDASILNQYFYPIALTANAKCTTGWSGNFLNWATMESIDEFRFAMTGGNRSTDTATTTILERSYQSGQGGTSNFPNKTFTDSDGQTTPYAAGTALTIVNSGQKLAMTVAQSSSSTDAYSCQNPVITNGSFNCTFTRVGTGDTGSCLTWGGTGTSASPFTCTSFTPFAGVSPTKVTASTTTGLVSGASTPSSTVTCASPDMNGQNGTFECASITLTNGSTGSCLSWDPTGNGTAAHPYTCTQFSTFSGGETVASVGAPTNSTATVSTYGTQVQGNYSSCSISSGTTSCSSTGNPAVTCSAPYSGTGSTSSPYACQNFAITPSGYHYVGFGVSSPATTVKSGSKWYNTSYNVEYQPIVNSTIYYAATYPVSTSTSYYYITSYTTNYGTTPETFQVRVKVCDSTVGLETNCAAYGSSYKPVGVIQKNGSTMRFGVTSYFNANDIDNAVLRSKAHFTAPTQFSGTNNTAANPYAEWSDSTGAFFTSPFNCADGTTTGSPLNCVADAATVNSYVGSMPNSGVINYINKFGKTAQNYKTYDDIGKLYYETLKYLRGTNGYPVTKALMGPTTDFYNGAKSTNADGFPVISTWDNPQATGWSCQKNYILAMGDAHTWCDKRLPGGDYTTVGSSVCNAYTDGNSHAHVQDTGSLGSDVVNVATETKLVGTTEGNSSTLDTVFTGTGDASYYMAGLAAWAARADIISGHTTPQAGDPPKVLVRSYVIDVQEYKDCNYRGQLWLTAKYGDPDAYDNNGNWIANNTAWSQQLGLSAGACASNGPSGYNNATGGTYTWPKQLLRGNDPQGMINSVTTAIASIAAQSGDEAALAQSSGSLDTGTGAYVYRASYNSGGWKGDVSALTVDTSGNFGASAAWTAATMLPTPANRTFLSWNPVTHTAFNFANDSNHHLPSGLSTAQAALLNTSDGGVVDGYGPDRLDYLRGVQSQEYYLPGTTTVNTNSTYGWRSRVSAVSSGTYVSTGGVLGDFIDSNPLFVGAPAFGYSFTGYKTFSLNNANRTPLLFVGANDGALHAFSAGYTISSTTGLPVTVSSPVASGSEVLAYIPSAVYPKLNQLMDPNYTHQYYVDGSPVYADICANTCAGASDWKSIVVGTTGAGGQSVFAIDVTSGSFTTSSGAPDTTKALWEFNDSDDQDLGSTFSQPIVRKLNDGKWYVIFGNGFNNTANDLHSSTSGRAELYFLQANGPGAGNAWVQGTNFYKIELVSPSESSSLTTRLNNPNGLSSVTAVDANGDDVPDMLYAGDRNGNLWKIDISSSNPANWGSAFKDPSSNVALPLFTAVGPQSTSPNAQQITTGVSVTVNPNGGYMLSFGTGSWVDNQDSFGPFNNIDSMYGIWDDNLGVQPTAGATAKITRSQLQPQGVVQYVGIDVNGNTIGTCTPGSTSITVNGTTTSITCYLVQSNCTVNYSNTTVVASNQGSLCPATLGTSPNGPYNIANSGNQGKQYGWVFDMLNAGERTRSAFPQVNGTNIRLQSLTPTSDPCAGNTIGQEYVLSALTGGMPASAVYIPGTTAGYTLYYNASTGALSTTGGTGYVPVSVNLSGKTVAGGASDNPVEFNIRPPSSLVTPPPGMPNPPTAPCTGAACNSAAGGSPYIPGWGFLMNLSGPTSANSAYVMSCHQPEFGNGAPVCQLEHKLGRFGQLTWKTINH